ncbi:UNVERIFIED_CONTAM: hypothetical protein GTU68_066244 [Idotea baltica]|nr:hypothetical protein [Idotea baltica]
MLNAVLPWHISSYERFIIQDELARAYLFYGAQGIGKKNLILNVIAYVFCENPSHLAVCGECQSCHLIAADNHPDFFYLEPETLDIPIKIDQIRALINFVEKTPQLGKKKIVLISPTESLNLNAANALLKSLEDPPGNTFFFLLSHQLNRVLATIKSRCVLQYCAPASKQQGIDYLSEYLPAETANTHKQLLYLAYSSPLLAVELFQQDILKQRALVVSDFKFFLKRQITAIQLAENWRNIPLIHLFDWFYDWAQRIVIYQLTQYEQQLGLDDMSKVIQYLAEKNSSETVFLIQDWLLCQRDKVIKQANLNKLLLIERLLLQWSGLTIK